MRDQLRTVDGDACAVPVGERSTLPGRIATAALLLIGTTGMLVGAQTGIAAIAFTGGTVNGPPPPLD